jgi:hypothetical protein
MKDAGDPVFDITASASYDPFVFADAVTHAFLLIPSYILYLLSAARLQPVLVSRNIIAQNLPACLNVHRLIIKVQIKAVNDGFTFGDSETKRCFHSKGIAVISAAR